MKTKNKYKARLLKFAEHLEKITNHSEHGIYDSASLVELEEKRQVSFLVKYHAWVFDELPALFSDWGFDATYGNPIWDGCHPDEGTVSSVCDFFDLKMEEFIHLFDIDGGQNTTRYGGSILSDESDGPDLAKNMIELVERKFSKS